ncbi:hypothetical protein [Nocardia cyriacigeorgica]|uniref:hypothetical protein n=1 Tax=Nocardia cyriacigeorgica TaxID=135487 RepID=UPI001BB26AF8|nr:hypothetical protein [Nocardia cyriacigeorgica]
MADNQNSMLMLLTHGQAIGAAVARSQELIRGLLDDIAAASKTLRRLTSGHRAASRRGISNHAGPAPGARPHGRAH